MSGGRRENLTTISEDIVLSTAAAEYSVSYAVPAVPSDLRSLARPEDSIEAVHRSRLAEKFSNLTRNKHLTPP